MSNQMNPEKAIEMLGSVAKELTSQSERRSVLVGREIELVTGQLNELRNLPPSPKTSDFEYPIGDEVELSKARDSSSAIFERIIDENDLLPVWFLERGVQIQRSVARVVLTQPHTVDGHTFPAGTGWATGFMVSPSLFLTNNHVIPDEDFAKKIRIQFNFQLGEAGIEQPTESFLPAQNNTFRTNKALDYTLIRLRPNQVAGDSGTSILAGNRWGFIPLNEDPIFREEQHFNIIQHPAGRRKEISLQDNDIDSLFLNAVRYKSDTEPGSSGSPVFDNLWQLVALHHAGGEKDETGKWLNNEGIRIDRIAEDLRQHFGDNGDEAVLEELGI